MKKLYNVLTILLINFLAVFNQSIDNDIFLDKERLHTVDIYAPYEIETCTDIITEFRCLAFSLQGKIIKYKWDFNGDDKYDLTTTISKSKYRYNNPGVYNAKIKAIHEEGYSNIWLVKVMVKENSCKQKDINELSIIDIQDRLELTESQKSGDNPDGIQKNYVIMITGSADYHWEPTLSIYNSLINRNSTHEDDIFVLIADNGTPSSNAEIIDGLATRENLRSTIDYISTIIDNDDNFILYIEWHGSGYLGYLADNNRNIAYHGFIGGQIKSSEEGDELDYPESSFEMSIFCGGKLIDGTDYHYGIGEWGINYYPEARLVRYMVLSHFSDLYVEEIGNISDNDVYIEQFTDYFLGDINKNGVIDDGEILDYDQDGILPYDHSTGQFDEDDWGYLDSYEDDLQWGHTGIGQRYYILWDKDFDNLVDIDLDATFDTPIENLKVDGTDIDNNGVVDFIDLNEDGDFDDWITINETVLIKGGTMSDDQLKFYLESIDYGNKIIILNTCYGGGLVNDLSGPNVVIMTGCRETESCSSGYFPKIIGISLSDYSADENDNYLISMAELFNYANEIRWCCIQSQFRYDDNGDYIYHPSPLPNGGDGVLGSSTDIEAISIIISPEEYYTLSTAYELNNNSKVIINPNAELIIDNTELKVNNGSTLYFRAVSNLQILGEGKISVLDGGYICLENGANLTLQDGLSVINLYNGYNTGVNTDVLPDPGTCISDVPNYSYTGNGSINTFDEDVYIQNKTFTEDSYITGKNIYAGSNVDPYQPTGPVEITNGSKIIFEPDQDVILEGVFELEVGSEFEIY